MARTLAIGTAGMTSMSTAERCGAHPRVRLSSSNGGTLDLDDFRTQKLVLFICPSADPETSAGEIGEYEALLPEFFDAGAWVVGIVAGPGDMGAVARRIRLGFDPGDRALRDLAGWAGIAADPVAGATFVFERDGGLREAWSSCGRAREALASVRE